MLGRFQSFCLKLFYLLFLSAWIFRTSEEALRFSRYQIDDWSLVITHGLFSIIVCLVLWILLKSSREPKPQPNTLSAQRRLKEALHGNKCLSYLLTIYRISASFILLFFICFYAQMSHTRGIQTLSYFLDKAGQYETAERLYSLFPSEKRCSSLSVLKSSFIDEKTPTESSLRDAAVKKIYGQKSREMADRYFKRGLLCSMASKRDNEAYNWFEKSLVLSHRNHATSQSIEALTQMTVLKLGVDNNKAKLLIQEIAHIWPQADRPMLANPSELLVYMSTKLKLNKEAIVFSTTPAKAIAEPASEPALWVDIATIAVSISAARLGCAFAQGAFWVWLRILSKASKHSRVLWYSQKLAPPRKLLRSLRNNTTQRFWRSKREQKRNKRPFKWNALNTPMHALHWIIRQESVRLVCATVIIWSVRL